MHLSRNIARQQANKLQLALALNGRIMALAVQSDYVPLEIMTDCAKRSYFTHLDCSLWGYHHICICGEKGHMALKYAGPNKTPNSTLCLTLDEQVGTGDQKGH